MTETVTEAAPIPDRRPPAVPAASASRPPEHDGWAWFHAPDAPAPDAPAAPATPAIADLPRCYARCFAGRDGQTVLAHLRSLTLERALGPHASDPALRHLEGQRELVRAINAQIRRGQNAAP